MAKIYDGMLSEVEVDEIAAGSGYIQLPEYVTKIAPMAFFFSEHLVGIFFSDSKKLKSIGVSAFNYCTKLTGIELPEGLESIGQKAFLGCTSMMYVSFPSSLVSIERCAFDACGFQSIILKNGLKEMGEYAFANCSNLEAISLPGSLKSIEEGAFFQCGKLKICFLAEGLESIKPNAFRGCISMESITLPKGLKSIGNCAFFGCKKLQSIILPESLQTIEGDVFDCCDSLKTICINTEDFTEFKRIKSLLPDKLQSLVTGFKALEKLTTGQDSFFDGRSRNPKRSLPEPLDEGAAVPVRSRL